VPGPEFYISILIFCSRHLAAFQQIGLVFPAAKLLVLRQFAWYKTGRTGAANRPGKSDTPPFHDMQGGERREKMPKSQKIAPRPARENSNHTPNFPFHILSPHLFNQPAAKIRYHPASHHLFGHAGEHHTGRAVPDRAKTQSSSTMLTPRPVRPVMQLEDSSLLLPLPTLPRLTRWFWRGRNINNWKDDVLVLNICATYPTTLSLYIYVCVYICIGIRYTYVYCEYL
jgi:hypothetical protein